MALFKILRGPSNRLNNQKAKNGWAYFTPDDGKFYIDIDGDGTTTEPIIGTSTINGANRICINAGGFMDNLILDCGTASGWIQVQTTYFDLGDSDLSDEMDALFYDSGDSDLLDEQNVIFFDSGNSYYNI